MSSSDGSENDMDMRFDVERVLMIDGIRTACVPAPKSSISVTDVHINHA
jgi:hypothetical protein